jgi:hypothetical protein
MTPSSERSRLPAFRSSDGGNRLAAAMDAAFVSNDVADEAALLPEAAVDDALLRTVPVPAPLDFETLEKEVDRQRRLVVRAVGIPIAGVLAIGGSLLIHALLVGGFLASFYVFLHSPLHGGGSTTADDEEMGGGSNGGTLFVTDVAVVGPGSPAKVPASPVAQAPVQPPVNVPSPPVALPKPPVVEPAPPQQIAMNVTPPMLNTPDIIGLPTKPDTVGAIHVAPLPSVPQPPVAPPAEVGLPIMAPPQNPILTSPAHSTGEVQNLGSSAGTAAHTSSPRPGLDDGMDDDDEETISLLSPGHGGGLGSGGGKRHGNGIDRGPSGGDNETPGVLDPPSFQLPAEYEYHPPKHRVILTVTVLASGRAGDIEIKQSCGIPEIDEAYKSLVAHQYKFRPAYRDGKPFAATIECSQAFSTDDE